MIEKTEIEKFINSLKAKAVKEEVNKAMTANLATDASYKMTAKERKEIRESYEEKYEVSIWIDEVLGTDLKKISSFIPTKKQAELFEFLSLPFVYKSTLKESFDNDLLKLREHLDNYSQDKYIVWKEKIKELNPDLIPLYMFFREFINEASKLDISPSQFIKEEIDDIANKAIHGTMISHASKFSHPAATNPRLYITKERKADGFIKTGNSETVFDLHINSTYLKVYRFLSLMINGKTIRDHLLSNSFTTIFSLFISDTSVISQWESKFQECLSSQNEETNQLIKQVFFPIKPDNYHLLSIIFPSSMAFELKKRIESIKYSDETIVGKRDESKKVLNEQGYSTISNITLYRHGGDHPKNISALNNKYQDVYLLDSCPPQLRGINKNLPKKDFFDSLWRKNYRTEIRGIHRILRAENEDAPQKRAALLNKYLIANPDFKTQLINQAKGDMDNGIQPHHLKILLSIVLDSIVYSLIDKVWLIRNEGEGWTSGKRFKQLPLDQKVLLDQTYEDSRLETDKWFSNFIQKCSDWIISTYQQELAKKQLPLTKDHRKIIQKLIATKKEVLL